MVKDQQQQNVKSRTIYTDLSKVRFFSREKLDFHWSAHLLEFKLRQEEVDVLGNVQFILPAVSHQVRVQDIVSLHKDLGQVTR